MRKLLALGCGLASIIGTSAGAAQVVIAPVIEQPAVAAPMVAPPPAYCHPYTDKFIIGREVRVTRGMACRRPDGSWELQPSTSAMHYFVRGGRVFLTPVTPFLVGPPVVIEGEHHRHHHWEH